MGASAPALPLSTQPATSRATAGPSTPPVPNGATSTPATAAPARTSPRPPGSPPTPGPMRPAPPPPLAPTTVVVSAPSDNHIHVPAVVTTPVQVSAPHVSATAPVVVVHEPVHTHFDRNEIPQGPYLAPIPKKAAEPDTAFPTK